MRGHRSEVMTRDYSLNIVVTYVHRSQVTVNTEHHMISYGLDQRPPNLPLEIMTLLGGPN